MGCREWPELVSGLWLEGGGGESVWDAGGEPDEGQVVEREEEGLEEQDLQNGGKEAEPKGPGEELGDEHGKKCRHEHCAGGGGIGFPTLQGKPDPNGEGSGDDHSQECEVKESDQQTGREGEGIPVECKEN